VELEALSSVASRQSSVVGQQSSVVSQESSVVSQESSVVGQESSAVSQESSADSRQTTVEGTTEGSRPATDDSRLTTEDSGLTTDVSRLTTEDSGLTTDVSRLTTEDSGLTTNVSRLTTEDSGLTTDDSRLTTAVPPPDLLARVRDIRARWQRDLALRGVDRERAVALDARFAAAFAGVIARWPATFDGTDLDPDANRKRMESLVKRVEDLAKSVAGPAAALDDAAMSPTTRLATMLKEALASNTIGGKVDEDARYRAAAEDARQAQAAWSRIGPVPDDIRRVLADRFQRALRVINEKAGGASRAGAAGGVGRVSGSSRQGRF